jgi:hypothetical protein
MWRVKISQMTFFDKMILIFRSNGVLLNDDSVKLLFGQMAFDQMVFDQMVFVQKMMFRSKEVCSNFFGKKNQHQFGV